MDSDWGVTLTSVIAKVLESLVRRGCRIFWLKQEFPMLTRQRTGKSSPVLMQSLLQLEDTREKVAGVHAHVPIRPLENFWFCGNSCASGSAVQDQDQWEGVETWRSGIQVACAVWSLENSGLALFHLRGAYHWAPFCLQCFSCRLWIHSWDNLKNQASLDVRF